MLEKNLQKKVMQFCMQNDILCVKVDSTSTRGWPDLTVIKPCGQVLFVELKKAKTGKLSALQKTTHEKIRHNNGRIYTIDNLDTFIEIVTG